MFDRRTPIALAHSGGKDSTFLLAALLQLHYEITPVAVDMGYSAGWSERVLSIEATLGRQGIVVPVRDHRFQATLVPIIRSSLQERLHILDCLNNDGSSVSPCTQCYNAKVTALQSVLKKQGVQCIAFGHHATDALASMLKSVFMYIDRWDRGHPKFDRAHFVALVEEGRDTLLGDSPERRRSLLRRIRELVISQKASTDEPPRQDLTRGDTSLRLVRPLFSLFEYEIEAAFFRWNISPEPSKCGHGAAQDTYTPRELVHFNILRALGGTPAGRSRLEELMELVQLGLAPDGTLLVDARAARDALLGPQYRSGYGSGLKL